MSNTWAILTLLTPSSARPSSRTASSNSGPEIRRPGSVEVRPEFGRRLEAGGGVGKRAPGQPLTISKAKRARLLLRRVGELQEAFVVAGGRGSGPVGVERDGPALLSRVEARERVVGGHRRNPMSIRSRGPMAFTVGKRGLGGAVAAWTGSRRACARGPSAARDTCDRPSHGAVGRRGSTGARSRARHGALRLMSLIVKYGSSIATKVLGWDPPKLRPICAS